MNLFTQFLFLQLEFPSVKNFFCISKVRFWYPFISYSVIFPLTSVHESVLIAVLNSLLFNDFFNFILFGIFSQSFQVLPVTSCIRSEGFQMSNAENRVDSIRVRKSNSVGNRTDIFCYFKGSVISSSELGFLVLWIPAVARNEY